MRKAEEYDDIPGTIVFDAERSRQGDHLNMQMMLAGGRSPKGNRYTSEWQNRG